MNRPPAWWRFEVVLVALDPGGEIGGVLPWNSAGRARYRARRAWDVALESCLDLGPPVALGMVGEELPGAVDQVAKLGVGQPFGADQVVDDLPFARPTAARRPGSSSV